MNIADRMIWTLVSGSVWSCPRFVSSIPCRWCSCCSRPRLAMWCQAWPRAVLASPPRHRLYRNSELIVPSLLLSPPAPCSRTHFLPTLSTGRGTFLLVKWTPTNTRTSTLCPSVNLQIFRIVCMEKYFYEPDTLIALIPTGLPVMINGW